MRKTTIVLLSILYSFLVSGQESARLKMIVCMNGTDTLTIEKYDQRKRLFWKSYLSDGRCNISIRKYEGNELKNTIWFMTNEGFVIQDFSFDNDKSRRLTYSYEMKKHKKTEAANLCSSQNETEVQKSKSFLEIYQKKNRYLQEVAFCRDSLFTKNIQFDSKGDTTKVTTYTYENNLLKKVTIINIKDTSTWNHMWDNLFSYDSNGDEIQCIYVRNETDTTSVVNKKYNNNLLVEEEHIRDKKFHSRKKYEYSNGLIISEKEYFSGDDLRHQSDYYYNENNTLVKIIRDDWVYYYFYD